MFSSETLLIHRKKNACTELLLSPKMRIFLTHGVCPWFVSGRVVRRPGAVMPVRRAIGAGPLKEWKNELNHLQTLRGSFSAASKPIFASKYWIFVRKVLTRSTRFTYFCTAQISKFQQKTVRNFGENDLKFISFQQKIDEFCHFSARFWRNVVGILRRILENCKISRYFDRTVKKKRKY